MSRWGFYLAVTRLKAVGEVPVTGHLCGIPGLSDLLEALHSDLEFYSICKDLNLFIFTPALPLKILTMTFRNIVLSIFAALVPL